MNHYVESLNGWMTSRWSSSNSNTNFNNTSKHFTQSEPSSPGEVSMSCLSFPNPNTQPFGAVNSASSASTQQYLPFNVPFTTVTKDSLINNSSTAARKDIYENSSVTDVEGQSTLSTDFADSYSTFLKLDVEDFIQSCIGQSSHSQQAFSQSLPNYYTCPFKQYAQRIPSQTATIPQEEETNPKSPSTRSLPPKISKNTPSRKTHSSSSSSLDSLLVPEKRKRNKRNCLPGETKMIMWKWNKATIKEGL